MQFVLDTDVVVAATRSDRGASRQLLNMALEGRCQLAVSASLLIEYEAVLKRPEQLAASEGTVEQIDILLDAIAGMAQRVSVTYLWRPQLVDPGDEMVLETAVSGGVDAIVSFNVRHLGEGAARFGIEVLRPREAFKLVREIR